MIVYLSRVNDIRLKYYSHSYRCATAPVGRARGC